MFAACGEEKLPAQLGPLLGQCLLAVNENEIAPFCLSKLAF